MNQPNKERFKTSVGGQALMEGIMMRGLLRRAQAGRHHRDQDRAHAYPWHLDKDPAGAGNDFHDRKPDHGLPLYDVLGPGQHGR